MNIFSEIKEKGWNLNTLKPPLKFIEILKDFKYQWQKYRYKKLSIKKCGLFLILRAFQRLSYNIGWIKSSKRLIKSHYQLGKN